MVSSKSNEWATPQDFFDELNEEFSFTLDPCSTDDNRKCEKHYTIDEDGLSKDWSGETVFANPPYGGNTAAWIRKAFTESKKAGLWSALLCHRLTGAISMTTYSRMRHKLGLLGVG